MIKIGKFGWGNFDCDEFSGTLSYLKDTPLDLLEAFKTYLEKHISVSIYMDEEGSSWTLVLNHYSIYIIAEREKAMLIELAMLPDDFIREILCDIENQIEEAVIWNGCEEDDDLEQREKEITGLLNRCKELLGRKL